jgi:hypothetical protein
MELNSEATDETEIGFVPFRLDCVRVALIPAAEESFCHDILILILRRNCLSIVVLFYLYFIC